MDAAKMEDEQANNIVPAAEIAEEEEDFESLPETAPLIAHLSAGALAGMAEHTLFYPVDTVKTRMQVLQQQQQSVTDAQNKKLRSITRAMRSIVAEEGVRGLWRGVPSVLLGAG